MLNCYCFSMIHSDELTSKKHCKNIYELYYVDEVFSEGLCHLVLIELNELLDVPTCIIGFPPSITLEPFWIMVYNIHNFKSFWINVYIICIFSY
jgi:hypothetical protein